MVRNLRLSQRLLLSHLIIIMICFISFGGFWIYQEVSQFRSESDSLKNAFIKERNKQVQTEVEKAVGYVELSKKRLLERLKKALKEKVDYACEVARQIVKANRGNMSDEEVIDLVRNTLRDLRFFDGRGYYFATNSKGVLTLYPIAPEMEGKSVAKGVGAEYERVNRDLIQLAAKNGEGFQLYDWARLDHPGGKYKKLSYVKLFEPFAWVIGAGEYLDDWEKSTQDQILNGLSSVLFGSEGYLFAGTYDGVSLLGPAKGKNMIQVKDLNGKPVVQELIKAAQEGGGFVQYVMPALDGKRQDAKVSYALGVPDWNWYVGAGYYMSEIEAELAAKQVALGEQIRTRIILIIGFILGLSFFAVLFSRLMTRKLVCELDVFKSFFNQAAESDQPVSVESLNTPEILELARAANVMIEQRQKARKEKAAIKDQLVQSQKMEAVGTLAGGVAHDFNNLLAIISGYTELALDNAFQGVSSEYELEQVQKAAMRGKDLVRQILTFSRHAKPDLKPVDLNQIVDFSSKILMRTLPKMISIDVSHGQKLWPILGDANQVEQVLLNLGNNAKDAMPEGGRVVIETMNLNLSADMIKAQPEALPGKYVLMRVADNGIGMDNETQKHVFEPFFTTKEVGKGTGLGLSTVFGIVKAHGGYLTCTSQPGRGTEISVYWPALPQAETADEKDASRTELIEGTESILIVDDEAGIREVNQRIFTMAGYGVVVAESGEAALDIYKRSRVKPALVVLDLGMPGMGGYRCLEELKGLDPDIKVVVASGYAQDPEVQNAIQLGANSFVPKPYTAGEILRAVRSVLDG